MRYLLDTNILIAAMKGEPTVREKLGTIPLSDIVLSPVVLGELAVGVEKSRHRDTNRARLEQIIASLHLLPLDTMVAQRYGVIRSELERLGTPIGANDYWIAAQALAVGAVLVTRNTREFSRVAGLTMEDWL